jgi:hypothetical protein
MTPPANRPSKKRRRLVVLTILVALLWIPAYRFVWYARVAWDFLPPKPDRDFSQLAKVLPPADAHLVAIHRGLPHQYHKKQQLLHDLYLTRNRELGGYRFYLGPATPSQELGARLTTMLQNASVFYPYSEGKQCGGYHPDFCLEWHSSQGTFLGLVCTGCGEILFVGNGMEVQCDLATGFLKELTLVLEPFQGPKED